jgi:hypothetical protein
MPTFPSSPSFESINFTINTPLIKTQTNSGKITRIAMGHQYYSFTVKYPRITARELGTVSGFISLTLGGYSAFQIVLPELSYSKAEESADAGRTFVVTASTSSGATVLSYQVSGSNTASKEFFAAGDFIKFSNHDKVYQITQTTSTNASSTGYIVIGGALVSAVPSSTTITRNAVPFTVILDGDAQEFDTGMGGISSLSLDMREVW